MITASDGTVYRVVRGRLVAAVSPERNDWKMFRGLRLWGWF